MFWETKGNIKIEDFLSMDSGLQTLYIASFLFRNEEIEKARRKVKA
ncbi:hypothetical protein ACQRC6_01055 [Peptoniphilus sp. SGI.035]